MKLQCSFCGARAKRLFFGTTICKREVCWKSMLQGMLHAFRDLHEVEHEHEHGSEDEEDDDGGGPKGPKRPTGVNMYG